MHILFVEDNHINQRIAQRIFNKIGPGCTFSAAWNGKEALEYLASSSAACPRPDIILMDISMPVIGGVEAVSILRTFPPYTTDPILSSTPIIVMSPPMLNADRQKCTQWGFDDMLSKPLRETHVRKMLMYWSARRVVPRHGVLQGPAVGGRVPIPAARAEWGLVGLRGFRGPRSLL